MLNSFHHTAIICSDYDRSKAFYTSILGLEILREVYPEDRKSYKLDLALNGMFILELFSFPSPPARSSRPEAAGLRHLAFAVTNVKNTKTELEAKGVTVEDIRIDAYTGKKFTFFADPDDLPIEIYEL
mgnify:FL=1